MHDLCHDLRDVLRDLRPDWDIAAPGLREAWDAGDRSGFYPYGEDGRTPRAGADGAKSK
jgi:hypothetical protein